MIPSVFARLILLEAFHCCTPHSRVPTLVCPPRIPGGVTRRLFSPFLSQRFVQYLWLKLKAGRNQQDRQGPGKYERNNSADV